MLTVQTDGFRNPIKITYHCSLCNKSRRPNAVVRRLGMCRLCYRITRTHQYRIPHLDATPQKCFWKLNRVAFLLGASFFFVALLGVIAGGPLPSWASYIILVPVTLVMFLTYYGMIVGSSVLLTFELQPDCLSFDCDAETKLVEKYPRGQSFWICEAGHSFYIGRFGFSGRSLKSVW